MTEFTIAVPSLRVLILFTLFQNTVTTGSFVLLRVLRCGLYIMLLHIDTVNVLVRVSDVQEKIWEGDVTDQWALGNVFFWGRLRKAE